MADFSPAPVAGMTGPSAKRRGPTMGEIGEGRFVTAGALLRMVSSVLELRVRSEEVGSDTTSGEGAKG